MSSYWWQPFVAPILKWWLSVFILGWISYPLVYRCCVLLPDKGLGLAKILGLVLPVFGYAIIANRWGLSEPAWENGAPLGLIMAIAGWAVINLILLRKSWRIIFDFLKNKWQTILLYETAFLIFYLLYLWFRSYIPDATFDALGWYGAEKWDNLAILTAIWRNPAIPPVDPWLSGHSLNYYYFSHLIWAMLARLSGVVPQVAFNLGLGTLFALLISISFSAGWAVSDRKRGGLLAVFLIVFAGSLATWDQYKDVFRPGVLLSKGLLTGINEFNLWLPSDVIPNTRNEFPAFNWLLGDLHAHGSGLLLMLTAICLLVQLFRIREVGRDTWAGILLQQPATWLVLLIVFAAMWATNSWDLLVAALIGWFMILASSMDDESRGLKLSQAIQGTLIWMITGLIAVSFLASFYSANTYPPLKVINPLLAKLPGPLAMLGSIGFVKASDRTTPDQWISFWGFFVFAAATIGALGALAFTAHKQDRVREFIQSWKSGANAPLPALIALSIAAVIFAYQFRQSIAWIPLAFAFGIVFCISALFRERFQGPKHWALLLAAVALLLQFIPEFIYVDDPIDAPHQRYNTVFKLYYPSWALLGLTLSALLANRPFALKMQTSIAIPQPSEQNLDLELEGRPAEILSDSGDQPSQIVVLDKSDATPMYGIPYKLILICLLIVLIVGAGVYPLLGIGERVSDSILRMKDLREKGWKEEQIQSTCRTLDGLAFLALPKYAASDDLKLGLWMRENLLAAEQIAEATGLSYEMTARFSVISGIPSFLGWLQHETQWRSEERFYPILNRRSPALETIYRSANPQEVLLICKQTGLRYVLVGNLERMKYPRERLEKFSKIGGIKKRFGQSVLYEIDLGNGGKISPTAPVLQAPIDKTKLNKK